MTRERPADRHAPVPPAMAGGADAPDARPGAHAWVVAAGFVAAAMAYTVWRSPTWWSIPRDPTLWDATQFLLHGHLGDVYSPTTGLVSFPGLEVLSLPVAAVADLFHLGTLSSGTGHALRPTAWLVWGPWTGLSAASLIVTADGVAARVGVGRGRRWALCLAEAAVVWQVVVLWGHAEDALATAAVLWAWVASTRGRWTAAGWLMGVAVAVQPLALLVAPLMYVLCPAGRRTWFVVRTLVIGAVLVVPELVASPSTTWRQLVHQPNYPTLDHPTPLLFLAPRLADIGGVPAVAAGPARLVALALCCVVAFGVHRHRPSDITVLWLFAVCFALRSMVESVMDPYYVVPALAVAVLVASTRRALFFVLTVLAAVLMSGYAQTVHSPWSWWGPLTVGMAVVLWASYPGFAHSDVGSAAPAPHAAPVG